ncbi:ABC transporter permease [Tepidanaerobacter syntrophicus]|uniref:ABC-2 type transport system permease protein n=2 Tax=Tepidanaerobacter syntrophicus TaxID=224999 RepID=A0A0U9HRX7_9FIRM|nr:ABC transporter permease [Tepidanaerobacter syntrophicus]GAQ25799.1 ABC-2 type transport system permease protein [Tepidanaerobacter syntrophicus]
MNAIISIFKKELKSIFYSPIAYVIGAVILGLAGYFFSVNLFVSRIADLTGVFMNLGVVLIFTVPALTMKLLAGEEQAGTMEFLLTSPISVFQLIIGKYLASLVFFLFITAFTLIYPGILFALSAPDSGIIIVSYIGFLLLVASYISVGLLCSSLTTSQVVASILSFGVLLLLWVSSWLSSNTSGILSSFIKTLSMSEHYMDFLRGIIDTSHLVYFVSIILVSLTLSAINISRRTCS